MKTFEGELTRVAVQVSDTEDIGGTALGRAVEAVGAGVVVAAIGGDGRDGSGKKADDGDERGLHFEGWVWFVIKNKGGRLLRVMVLEVFGLLVDAGE